MSCFLKDILSQVKRSKVQVSLTVLALPSSECSWEWQIQMLIAANRIYFFAVESDEESVILTSVPVSEEPTEARQMGPSISSISEANLKIPTPGDDVSLPQTSAQFKACPKSFRLQ